MGGNISLHELVINADIKAAEILAGVVGNETEILAWWDKRIVGNDLDTAGLVQKMIQIHGTPQSNPAYWNAIDPIQFFSNITAPVEIQVGTADEDIPVHFASSLRDELQKEGKSVFYKVYPGADHNLSPFTSTAMTEAVSFFNKNLK